MTTHLTLLCSGVTEAGQKGAFPLDEPLKPGGADAAAKLAGKIRKADRVWTSPLLRAQQTAQALFPTSEPIDTLRDMDFGRWAGKTVAEIQRSDPDGLRAWLSEPQSAPHDGESVGDVTTRISLVLEQFGAVRGHTVAVTHSAVIRAVVVNVLGAPLQAFWQIDVEPLGIVELTNDGRRWALRFGNRDWG